MKTGKFKIYCPKCSSKEYSKDGKRKMKKNQLPIQQYKCKSCKHRFTSNALKPTYRQRKPELNKQVMAMYCEGNTLRGMSRLLGVSYNTVVAKFRFMAALARDRHIKAMQEGEFVTTYVQFDEMITFEGNRRNKLGIQLAVRPKTGQILSARVCEIPSNMVFYRSGESNPDSTDRKNKMKVMLSETGYFLNGRYSVLSFDGAKINKDLASKICPESLQEVHIKDYAGMWRLNQVCGKLRQRISRLQRKTWATTKDRRYLQMHLDMFIACQNGYKL